MQSVFDYLDYRDFLRDFYEERKFESTLSSYRMLAEYFGMDTANMFRILKGQAHLPVRSHSKAIEFLGLAGKEAEFFLLLISHSRERNIGLRKELLEKARSLRSGRYGARRPSTFTSGEPGQEEQSESVEHLPRLQRDVASLTFAGDLETLHDIQEILLRCRHQIQKRIERTEQPDRLLQVEMTILPVSQMLHASADMDMPTAAIWKVPAQGV